MLQLPRTIRFIALAVACFVIGLSMACGETVEPAPDGALDISWEVSPRGCGQTGVETVQVDLKFEQGVVTESFPCKKGEATIGSLEPANYKVRLWGIDAVGDSTFAAGPRKVTLHGGETVSMATMRMTAQPGELRIVWRFENGLVCGANSVDTIDVALYDMDDYQIRQRSLACSKGEVLLDDVPPSHYQIELRADNGGNGFVGSRPVRVHRGKATGAEVVLERKESDAHQ